MPFSLTYKLRADVIILPNLVVDSNSTAAKNDSEDNI